MYAIISDHNEHPVKILNPINGGKPLPYVRQLELLAYQQLRDSEYKHSIINLDQPPRAYTRNLPIKLKLEGYTRITLDFHPNTMEVWESNGVQVWVIHDSKKAWSSNLIDDLTPYVHTEKAAV